MLKIIAYIIATITCTACLAVAIILRKQERNGFKRSIKFFIGGIIYALIFFPIVIFGKVDALTVALLVMPLPAYLLLFYSYTREAKEKMLTKENWEKESRVQ